MSRKNLARIVIDLSYVVDINDPDMIEEATQCIYEDIMNAVKYNELENYIVMQDPDPNLTEDDIPEFLVDQDKEVEDSYIP
ncbi:MAG: hypothetical protein EBU90_01335 [Proteobacteria bacterium]|nr:hypothetical protein [Pseudomonadota bacterium]NBP12804.1 hypothetical protein [bacterium]